MGSIKGTKRIRIPEDDTSVSKSKLGIVLGRACQGEWIGGGYLLSNRGQCEGREEWRGLVRRVSLSSERCGAIRLLSFVNFP